MAEEQAAKQTKQFQDVVKKAKEAAAEKETAIKNLEATERKLTEAEEEIQQLQRINERHTIKDPQVKLENVNISFIYHYLTFFRFRSHFVLPVKS